MIRDVTDPNKLISALKKDHKGLLIVSKSFLLNCNPEIIRHVRDSFNRYYIIIIKDVSFEDQNNLEALSVIEQDDSERIIYQKVEKCLQKLYNPVERDRPLEEISQREKEVLKLVAMGMTNKEIAERLYISLHTVITHRRNITAKLGIKTIAGLTVYALLNKLISSEDIK